MTTRNAPIRTSVNTKSATDLYREGFDRIFGKKEKVTAPYPPKVEPGKNAPRNSAIQGAGADMIREHSDSRIDPATQTMSDREWAAMPANLREGCTTHVDGVGDL